MVLSFGHLEPTVCEPAGAFWCLGFAYGLQRSIGVGLAVRSLWFTASISMVFMV